MIMVPIILVALMAAAAACIGGVLILRARGVQHDTDVQLGTQSVCPHCKLLNPTHARFCGHCGKALQ
jgi:hypothetical protein